ncbi:MAG: hypothetical protein NTU44_08750 [Bacteroidetes bacterium]|nr:hypothetical protein [Bacteroidota bacterium]
MKKKTFHSFIWIPRSLTILYVLFAAIFAFDSFQGDKSVFVGILDFLYQLVPVILIIILLIITWKRPWWAGLVFLLTGIGYTLYFNSDQALTRNLLITVPLILAGFLFLVSGFLKRKITPPKHGSSSGIKP